MYYLLPSLRHADMLWIQIITPLLKKHVLINNILASVLIPTKESEK